MSLQAGKSWEFDKLKFHGLSLSGIRTAISMPEFSLSFDVAQGFPYLLNLKHFFLSHGHLDHAAGVPYIISQKAMTSQAPGNFYMPESLVEPLDRIMKIWQEIEKHEYQYNFMATRPDDEIQLNANHYLKAFPTKHRVDSLGYTLFEKNRKLKKEYSHLNQDQIIDLRRQNIDVQEWIHTPLVSFTGDTEIDFLDSRPWIKKSKILILETTYLDERKSIEQAKHWGHTHLDELIPRLDDIESEQIVLIHISSRYSDRDIQKIIQEKIPAKHRPRIAVFPGR